MMNKLYTYQFVPIMLNFWVLENFQEPPSGHSKPLGGLCHFRVIFGFQRWNRLAVRLTLPGDVWLFT